MGNTSNPILGSAHVVPSLILGNWGVGKAEGKKIITYLDCATLQIKSSGVGVLNFAESCYLNEAAEINNLIDSAPGALLGMDDEALSSLSKGSTISTFAKAVSQDRRFRAVSAVASIARRSNYEFRCLIREFEKLLPAATSFDLTQRVLNHLASGYQMTKQELSHWSFVVFHSINQKLLICDRPVFRTSLPHKKTEMLLMPLSPSVFLFGVPNTDKNAPMTMMNRPGFLGDLTF